MKPCCSKINAGDTLTYTLGAMKPETVIKEVVTADAIAKQVALDKVRHSLFVWHIMRIALST